MCQSNDPIYNFTCSSLKNQPRFFSPCKMKDGTRALCNNGSIYNIANVNNVNNTIKYDKNKIIGETNNAIYHCDIPFNIHSNTCNSELLVMCKNGKKVFKCPSLATGGNNVYICGNNQNDCVSQSEQIYYSSNLAANSGCNPVNNESNDMLKCTRFHKGGI